MPNNVTVVEEPPEPEFICDTCEYEAPPDTPAYEDAISGATLCEDCYIDTHVLCGWCDEYDHVDIAVYLDNYGVYVCEGCYSDSVRTCEECGVLRHYDDIYYGPNDEYWCSACEEEHQGGDWVRRWGDKPQPLFINEDHTTAFTQTPGSWYMGMEVELESSSDCNLYDAMEYAHDKVGHIYVTTDGSLRDGLEIVTHPGTFDAWREGLVLDWDKWTNLVHNKVAHQEEFSSNGIHVHVSRTAFSDGKNPSQKSAHLYRFMHFIQSHHDAVGIIAGRGEADYCRWNFTRDLQTRKSDAMAKSGNRSDRYRPINTQNQHTVEVRIFDGRSDPAFMMRALEFLHAVVEMTRYSKSKLETWPSFESYVAERKDVYPNLHEQLSNDPDLTILAQANRIVNRREVKKVYAQMYAEEKRRRELELANRQARQRAEEAVSDLYDDIEDDYDPDFCDCGLCNGGPY